MKRIILETRTKGEIRVVTNPVFSIVIPVFNSEQSLPELCDRLFKVMETDFKQDFELFLVDDASKDRSWDVLKELKQKYPGITIIQLARNFGQHNATLCGFNFCRGEYVITLDDDLQHPPEELPKLYRRLLESGADVVVGRPESKKHSLFRNLGSRIMDRAYQRIFKKPAGLYIGSFRIIKAWVVSEVILHKSPNPMVNGLILQTTSRIVNETVNHQQRAYGSSNYSLQKIIKLVLDLFINFSTIPLRIVSGCGFVFSGVSAIGGIILIIRKLMGLISMPGWTSIMLLFLFFSGLNMIVFGVIGEYLARIIKEVTFTKQYLIREKID